MPLGPTTRAQVDGHRFVMRRARHAVVGRDARMLHDPLRRQSASVGVGVVVTLLVCAGAAVLALLRPAPDVDRATIMVGRESGAMYVRHGDLVHPVLNLASARLVLGSPDSPVVVRDSDIAGTPRGPLIGIPGAPSSLPPVLDEVAAASMHWTVCDEYDGDRTGIRQTAVMVGYPDERGGTAGETEPLAADGAVLASYGGQGWLLRDGSRARIDLADASLLEALGLAAGPVRSVSASLLEALPDVGVVARPHIPLAGSPVPYGLPGIRVGQVFTVVTTDGTRTYVALPDGIQRIGPVVADLIRSDSTVGGVGRLPPDALDVPRSTALDTAALPPTVPAVPDPESSPVLCVRTTTDGAFSTRDSRLSVGGRPPAAWPPTETAGADGPGPAVDRIGVPGGGVLVAAVPRAGSARPATEVLTVIDDTGVRFDVPDPETAAALGVGGTPVPVDATGLQRLPAGATLDREAALVIHDGMEAIHPGRAGVR